MWTAYYVVRRIEAEVGIRLFTSIRNRLSVENETHLLNRKIIFTYILKFNCSIVVLLSVNSMWVIA